jgi:hypothetical protein
VRAGVRVRLFDLRWSDERWAAAAAGAAAALDGADAALAREEGVERGVRTRGGIVGVSEGGELKRCSSQAERAVSDER